MNSTDNKSPLVSVIIPVHERANLLPRTLQSVVKQTYRKIEIIIVDDGSSQDIKSVTDGFGDPRIRYFRHPEKMGPSAARNTGIRLSGGEFITFLDSDDEYLPEKIEKQVEMLSGNGSGDGIRAAYCGMLKETGGEYRMRRPVVEWDISHQQLMVRRDAIEDTGFFDCSFSCVEDTDYMYRLSRTCRFTGSSEPLVIYHTTAGSLSRDPGMLVSYTWRFIRKHSSTLPKTEKSRWLIYMGNNCIKTGSISRGYGYFFMAFVERPLNGRVLKKLVRFAPYALFHLCRKTPEIPDGKLPAEIDCK